MPTVIEVQPDAGLLWRQKVSPPAMESHIAPCKNWIYVSPDGHDEIGTGSIAEPYKTLTAALASITDASPTKRYTVLVTGRITEPGDVVLPPNVFLAGSSPFTCRVQAASWSLGPAWAAVGDNRTGFLNLTVAGAVSLDFAAHSSNEGKAYFVGAWVNQAVDVRAFSLVNQVYAENAVTFAPWTFAGCSLTSQSNMYQASVSMAEAPDGGRFELISIGDAFLAELGLTKATNDADAAQLLGSTVQQLVASGALTVRATVGGIESQQLAGAAAVYNLSEVRTVGAQSRRWSSGAAAPEGAVTGSIGDMYSQTSDPGALWFKSSGDATDTGWQSVGLF